MSAGKKKKKKEKQEVLFFTIICTKKKKKVLFTEMKKKSLPLQLVTQNDLMYSRMCSDRLPATFIISILKLQVNFHLL